VTYGGYLGYICDICSPISTYFTPAITTSPSSPIKVPPASCGLNGYVNNVFLFCFCFFKVCFHFVIMGYCV
jgi:hypothetical protein